MSVHNGGFKFISSPTAAQPSKKKRRAELSIAAPQKEKEPTAEAPGVLYQGKDAKLVAFLFVLARDHLPIGAIEAVMENHIGKIVANGNQPLFADGNMANWAIDLAKRLG